MMVDVGSEKGTIDTQEKEFIQNVFEFNDITAEEIAVHRTDVTVLWLEDDISVWAETIHENRHTQYPMCDGSIDNIVGILNAKDYFRLADKTRDSILKSAVHPAYFVPETIKADVLFRNMKKTRNSMSIVLDEYGGVVGIVTLYDLIEELVGDLNDDPEDEKNPEPIIEKVSDNIWKIIGNVELKDLEEATGLELASEEYDTFTGLVFDALGMVPNDGAQSIDLSLPEMDIHVSCIIGHQIEAATLTVKSDASATKETMGK